MRVRARRVIALLVLVLAAAGAALAPTASAVLRSRLTLSPHTRTVRADHVLHLDARLTGMTGALHGKRITFYSRPAGAARWTAVATVTTDGDGAARLDRRVRRSGDWQARWSGDLLYDGTTSTVTHVHVPRPRPSFGRRVVAEAARHRGAPYEYGAAGPRAFDCSGFTQYVFGRFHVWLPHNAAAQYDDVRHVARSRKRLGDLVFFTGSSGIYHVGIYAGRGRMWAATHTGDYVRLESIYSSSYLVGRVHHR